MLNYGPFKSLLFISYIGNNGWNWLVPWHPLFRGLTVREAKIKKILIFFLRIPPPLPFHFTLLPPSDFPIDPICRLPKQSRHLANEVGWCRGNNEASRWKPNTRCLMFCTLPGWKIRRTAIQQYRCDMDFPLVLPLHVQVWSESKLWCCVVKSKVTWEETKMLK